MKPIIVEVADDLYDDMVKAGLMVGEELSIFLVNHLAMYCQNALMTPQDKAIRETSCKRGKPRKDTEDDELRCSNWGIIVCKIQS